MTGRVRLVLRFASEAAARTIHDAVRLENEGYVTTRVDGRELTAEATADDVGGLLHTTDDLLACVSVAESVLGDEETAGRD